MWWLDGFHHSLSLENDLSLDMIDAQGQQPFREDKSKLLPFC